MQDLGAAGATKRPTSCMLILKTAPKGDVGEEDAKKFEADFDEVVKEIKEITSTTIFT